MTVSDLGFLAFTFSVPAAASASSANKSHVTPPSREMLTSTLLIAALAVQVMSYRWPFIHCSPVAGDETVTVAAGG